MARTCPGCGNIIGAVLPNGMECRHDVIEWEGATGWLLTELTDADTKLVNCATFGRRTTTVPGRGRRVWEIITERKEEAPFVSDYRRCQLSAQ